MSHLGDRLVSLIDGELDHDARDKVLAHLAVCQECRVEADEQRRLKGIVSNLDGPEPSSDLVHRLRALAEPGEPGPPAPPAAPGGFAGGPLAAFHEGPSGPPQPPPPAARPGWRKANLALAGMFCLATAAATTAFAVGDRDTTAVRVTPQVDRYAVEHAVTVPHVPLTDPAVGSAVTVSTAPSP